MIEEQLKEEEKKCKEMLDLKITAEQTLELTQEDAKAMHERRTTNRDDIIKQRMRLSQLKKQRERLETEDEELDINNKETNKENEKLEADNERLETKIVELIQRIDVSTLLKEIDIEEMKQQASATINMNMAFQAMMNRFESIRTQATDV